MNKAKRLTKFVRARDNVFLAFSVFDDIETGQTDVVMPKEWKRARRNWKTALHELREAEKALLPGDLSDD